MSLKHKPAAIITLLATVLIPSILFNIYFLITRTPASRGVPVIGVIDGDTFVLEGKTKIRLRELDAPELEFCGGNEAKKYLESLISGKNVRIDEQVPDQRGRGMALVYAGNALINEEMLASGWVRYHHDNTSKSDVLKKASVQAKENLKGVYGLCQSTENKDNPKCVIKGNIDKNSDRRNYYLPGCAQYQFTIVEKEIGENWFCSEKDAQKAGFTRAKTCD